MADAAAVDPASVRRPGRAGARSAGLDARGARGGVGGAGRRARRGGRPGPALVAARVALALLDRPDGGRGGPGGARATGRGGDRAGRGAAARRHGRRRPTARAVPAGEARAVWVGAPADPVLAMLGVLERDGALEVVRVVVPGTGGAARAFALLVAALPRRGRRRGGAAGPGPGLVQAVRPGGVRRGGRLPQCSWAPGREPAGASRRWCEVRACGSPCSSQCTGSRAR